MSHYESEIQFHIDGMKFNITMSRDYSCGLLPWVESLIKDNNPETMKVEGGDLIHFAWHSHKKSDAKIVIFTYETYQRSLKTLRSFLIGENRLC